MQAATSLIVPAEGNGLRRPPQRSNSDAGAAAEAAASSRLGRGFNGAAEPPASGPPKQRSPERLAVGPPAGVSALVLEADLPVVLKRGKVAVRPMPG